MMTCFLGVILRAVIAAPEPPVIHLFNGKDHRAPDDPHGEGRLPGEVRRRGLERPLEDGQRPRGGGVNETDAGAAAVAVALAEELGHG